MFISKANKNRILFNFHILKDQLNLLVKETLKTSYLKKSIHKVILISNFYFLLNSKFSLTPIKLNMFDFFNQLKSKKKFFSRDVLILNKLNINKNTFINTKFYNLETLFLLNSTNK